MKKVIIDARTASYNDKGRCLTTGQAMMEALEPLKPGDVIEVTAMVNRWGEDSLTIHNARQTVSNCNKRLKPSGRYFSVSETFGRITVHRLA